MDTKSTQQREIKLLNEQQVAELLGVSVGTLRRRRVQGQPPAFLKIGHLVKYRPESIEAFVGECEVSR